MGLLASVRTTEGQDMAKTQGSAVTTQKRAAVARPAKDKARCLSVANRGIETAADFAQFMSGLMSDLIEGRVSPQIGNAACNAGGKLLKIVEMSYKYGTEVTQTPVKRSLPLVDMRSLPPTA